MSTPIGDMVEAMLAKDAPAEIVVLAVRTIEVSRETSADMSADTADKHERRLAADRDRKRTKRAQIKLQGGGKQTMSVSNVSADSPQTAADKRCDLSSILSEKEASEEEVRKKNPTSVVDRAKPKRGTRLEAGTPLSDADLQFALREGMTPDRARQAWAEFVDYWTGVPGHRGTKLNWPGTWRNRVRELVGRKGRPTQKPDQPSFHDIARNLRSRTDETTDHLPDESHEPKFALTGPRLPG